jgi:hypothetical protein
MKNNALANRQLLPSILALAWMPGGIGILEIRVQKISKNRRCLFLPSLPEERIVNPNNGASLFTTIRTADPLNFRINHSSGLLPSSVFSNQVGPVRLSLAAFQFLRGAAWRASCHRKAVNRQADEA